MGQHGLAGVEGDFSSLNLPEGGMIDVEEELGLVGENVAERNGSRRVPRLDGEGALSKPIGRLVKQKRRRCQSEATEILSCLLYFLLPFLICTCKA